MPLASLTAETQSPIREQERQAYFPTLLRKGTSREKVTFKERPSPWRTNIYCVLITTYTSHCFQDVWATCQKVYNPCFHPDLFSHIILITEYLYHFTQCCEGCICLFSLCLQSKNLSMAVLGGGIKLHEEGGNLSKSTQINGKMFQILCKTGLDDEIKLIFIKKLKCKGLIRPYSVGWAQCRRIHKDWRKTASLMMYVMDEWLSQLSSEFRVLTAAKWRAKSKTWTS